MFEIRETVDTSELKYGRTVVGQTAVQLTDIDFIFNKGIKIRAPGVGDDIPNSKTVWIGKKGVTIVTGYPLIPGESIELLVKDPTKVFVISDAASQEVAWMGL